VTPEHVLIAAVTLVSFSVGAYFGIWLAFEEQGIAKQEAARASRVVAAMMEGLWPSVMAGEWESRDTRRHERTPDDSTDCASSSWCPWR
jgi:hypothetical protein